METGSLAWEGRTVGDGRYRVERRLGAGGMGVVFLAHDANLDTRVVLKVPHPHLIGEATIRERFEREVRSLVKLQHPSIVRIIDLGHEAGLPFAVLTYLGGGDLDARRPRSTAGGFAPTSPAELDTWLPTIGRALDFVHAQGLLHRDVKPGNVLFDEHGHAFLGDFGIVTLLDPADRSRQTAALTSPGGIIGTPEYLAPELIMAQDSDGRADQYALAMATYEVLAGKVPFDGATTVILLQQVQEPVPLLDQVVPYASPALAQAIARGLAKAPSDRFSNCAAFADAVLAAVARSTSRCPACGTALPLKPEHVGGRTRCPACSVRLAIGPNLVVGTPEGGETVPEVAKTASPSEAVGVASAASIESTPRAEPTVPPSGETEEAPARAERPWRRALPNRLLYPIGGVLTLGLLVGIGWYAWPRAADSASRGSTPDDRVTTSAPAAPLVAPFPEEEALRAREAWAAKLGVEPEFENELGMKLVLVPPGEFQMGADESLRAAAERFSLRQVDAQRHFGDEYPKHDVELTQPFYVGMYEVTKSQFAKFVDDAQYKTASMRTKKGGHGYRRLIGRFVEDPRYDWRNTGFPYEDDHPVVNVSWIDAQAFCMWLTLKTGRRYQLLTEAEWEYCCRAGTETVFPFGDDPAELTKYTNSADEMLHKELVNYPDWNYLSGSDGFTFLAPVGRFPPNAFGIHDMLGNVGEWCSDFYGERYYARGVSVDPVGPDGPRRGPATRVVRGGRWAFFPMGVQALEPLPTRTPRVQGRRRLPRSYLDR